jgi:hypothetical protein
VLPDLGDLPEPCPRRHPGWGDGVDYRRLTDDPPNVRCVSAPTTALLIDHERGGYGGEVALAAGTLLLWIGSAHELHHSGGVLYGAHVLAVLSGDLRGECVEVRVDQEGRENHLPDAIPPAGELEPVHRMPMPWPDLASLAALVRSLTTHERFEFAR